MINKTVKEVLRLLKRDRIISEGEYLRMWNDYKHIHKSSNAILIGGKVMNTTIGGEGLMCPHCGKKVVVSFDHTMSDKHLDEIQASVYLKEYD
jgi:DNA-directed RNA polymerase subunit RPC12/RpoP